ncbi:MAG: vWA domain-containing protein [Planctomycetota bacterium]
MPNPTINPPWAVDASYTVSDSDYLALDVHLSELGEEDAGIELTVPAGGSLHVVRDPAAWTDAGSELLGGAGWTGVPVVLGNWTVTVSPGAAVSDPATVEVANGDGTSPTGILRLIITSLAGSACDVSPAGGTLSIDRLLAGPAILNAQVTSGTPVEELDPVTLGATASATFEANPTPAVALAPVPAVLAEWEPEPANPVALADFASVGTNASFTAPSVYDTVNVEFRLTAAYDLAASGVIDAGDPRHEELLAVEISTVGFGLLLVLDRSGSMGGGKWDATQQAAHAWLDLFRSFRSGDTHLAGIVTFEHDGCSWTEADPSDVTLRDPENGTALDPVSKPMSPLSSLGDTPVLNLGSPQSCTPIGDALVEGLKVLQTNLQPGSKAAMVLLTDGYENSGRVTIAAERGNAAATFEDERTTPALSFGNDLVGDRLFTVAVGSSVDEDRLNDLPNPAGAQMGPGYYRLVSDTAEILPTFADMLGLVLDAQPATPQVGLVDPDSPPNALYFEAPTGEQRIALLIPWPSATHELRVGWRDQGSNGSFTLIDPSDAAVVGYWRRQFHGLLTVDLTVLKGSGTPPATEWRIQHMNGAVAQPLTDADVLCMIDLVTKASIRFDRPQYFLGDPIRLECSIRTGGQRVTGATVGVDVAKPGEGLGTFLATNAGVYRKLAGSQDVASTAAGVGPGLASGPDPDQGKGLMFKTLLKHRELDGLPVVTPPDFQLHDDGAHDDGAANDGDYAGAFTETDKEGTYTFRFRVSGTLPDGSRFSRLFVRSTWVGVRPDPLATEMVWAVLDGLPAGQLGQLVTFTPKSKGGELLGPFRTAVIDLAVSDGTLDGPLVDNLDGSYSQRVLYRRDQDPVVSIEIYGTPMTPQAPTLVAKPGCLGLWLLAIRELLRTLLPFLFKS